MSFRSFGSVKLAVLLAVVLQLLPVSPGFADGLQSFPPVTNADGRFGLCDVLPDFPRGSAVSWMQSAYNAGARINRWEFRWDHIEANAGVWNYTSVDAAVTQSVQAGIDVLGILIATPGWAIASGQRPGNGLPRGLYASASDPQNLWAEYVRQTVNRYKGTVKYWEIWNEPDLPFFWSGTPDDYFQLLRVSYVVIKEIDPAARVLMAGMVVPDLRFVGRVLQDSAKDPAAAGSKGYFDVAAWHAYSPAKTVLSGVGLFKSLLENRGFPYKPIWLTEDGFPTSNPNGESRQAAYVLQTVAYALAAGVEKILIYRASDDADHRNWGLMTAAGDTRAGYAAFQVVARYFSHVQAAVYAPIPGIERFTFYEPGQHVTVLWTTGLGNRSIDTPAGQSTATAVDWTGKTTALTAANGTYHLLLPGARYNAGIDSRGAVVGGPPVVLLESNTSPDSLSDHTYIPGIEGMNRRLILFNPGDGPLSAEIQAAARPKERVLVQIPPRGLRTVDLDLISGTDYHGVFVASSTAPISGMATSNNGTTVHSIEPARTWYMSLPARMVTLTNTSDRPVTAHIVAFGPKGMERARADVVLALSLRRFEWLTPKSALSRSTALVIEATGPILVGGASMSTAAPVPLPHSVWYALHPESTGIILFNPNSTVPADISVHLVGSSAVKGLQLRVAPHHSYVLSTRLARAVAVTATTPIVASYVHRPRLIPPLSSQPALTTTITTGGRTHHVVLFNSSGLRAHVVLDVISGAPTHVIERVLKPSQVYTIETRAPFAPPRGAIVNSDVPIVAAPAP